MILIILSAVCTILNGICSALSLTHEQKDIGIIYACTTVLWFIITAIHCKKYAIKRQEGTK